MAVRFPAHLAELEHLEQTARPGPHAASDRSPALGSRCRSRSRSPRRRSGSAGMPGRVSARSRQRAATGVAMLREPRVPAATSVAGCSPATSIGPSIRLLYHPGPRLHVAPRRSIRCARPGAPLAPLANGRDRSKPERAAGHSIGSILSSCVASRCCDGVPMWYQLAAVSNAATRSSAREQRRARARELERAARERARAPAARTGNPHAGAVIEHGLLAVAGDAPVRVVDYAELGRDAAPRRVAIVSAARSRWKASIGAGQVGEMSR